MSRLIGLDISAHQGSVDWQSFDPTANFVIIRCGWGDNIWTQDDKQFENNVHYCNRLGIPYGIYLYSYAKHINGTGENAESAESEVAHVKRLIDGYNNRGGRESWDICKPFCVYLDMEDKSTLGNIDNMTEYERLTRIATYFINNLQRNISTVNVPKVGIYASQWWFNSKLDSQAIYNDGASIWCAMWPEGDKDINVPNSQFTGPDIFVPWDIWQFTSHGHYAGFTGRVDVNVATSDLAIKLINGKISSSSNISRISTNSSTASVVKGSTNYEIQNTTEGPGFNDFYDKVFSKYGSNIGGIVNKYVESKDHTIKVTNINIGNPYYYKEGKSLGTINGLNPSIYVPNDENVGKSFGDNKYSIIRGLGGYQKVGSSWTHKYDTVLANCVGYAVGRLQELWNAAIETGTIIKDTSGYKLKSTGQNIGDFYKSDGSHKVRGWEAYLWFNKWDELLSATGFSKFSAPLSNDFRPLPGDVVCFKNNNNPSEGGHVMIVEAVYNRDKVDEFIICSESAWGSWGSEIVARCYEKSMAKSSGYNSYSGFTLLGFLRSPVSYTSSLYAGTKTLNISISDVSLDAVRVLKEANDSLAAGNNNVFSDLGINTSVTPIWLGNTKADESGTKVNRLNSVGVLLSVDKSSKRPYKVGFGENKDIIVYYKREEITDNLNRIKTK